MNKNLSFALQVAAGIVAVLAMIFKWGILVIILCLIVIGFFAIYTPNSNEGDKK